MEAEGRDTDKASPVVTRYKASTQKPAPSCPPPSARLSGSAEPPPPTPRSRFSSMEVHQPPYNFSTQFSTNNPNPNSPPPPAPPPAPPISPPIPPPAAIAAAIAPAPAADAPLPPATADTNNSTATPPSPTPLLAPIPATTTPSATAADGATASAALEEASHVAVLSTPPDLATIPIEPPHGSPPPPPGELLPDVAAAEEVASAPTADPSVFTPPPVTPTPPTDPEDIRPMDEDSPRRPEPSTEVLSATPQPGTDLTLSHVPLGATPHHIDEDADVKMEEDVKADAEQQTQAPLEIRQENGYLNGITPAATLELISEQPVYPINGSNGFIKSPSPGAALYPSSSYSALDHEADGPPPAKRQKLEPSVSMLPLCQPCATSIACRVYKTSHG